MHAKRCKHLTFCLNIWPFLMRNIKCQWQIMYISINSLRRTSLVVGLRNNTQESECSKMLYTSFREHVRSSCTWEQERRRDVLALWQNLRVQVGNIMSWFKHAWEQKHHCWRKYSSQHKRRGFGVLLSRARIKKQGLSKERFPDIHPHLTSWKLYILKRLHQHPVRCSADQRFILFISRA